MSHQHLVLRYILDITRRGKIQPFQKGIFFLLLLPFCQYCKIFICVVFALMLLYSYCMCVQQSGVICVRSETWQTKGSGTKEYRKGVHVFVCEWVPDSWKEGLPTLPLRALRSTWGTCPAMFAAHSMHNDRQCLLPQVCRRSGLMCVLTWKGLKTNE